MIYPDVATLKIRDDLAAALRAIRPERPRVRQHMPVRALVERLLRFDAPLRWATFASPSGSLAVKLAK